MTDGKFHRIGVVANLTKEEAVSILRALVPGLLDNNFLVYLDQELEGRFAPERGSVRYGIPSDIDLVIAVGGDGTMLKYARVFLDTEAPILGLKGGTLGFLTEGRIDRVAQWLREGRFQTQKRMRIEANIFRGEARDRQFNALNEFVIHGYGYSRMVMVHIDVDGRSLRPFSADGIIVATPTGSTAYSLSAGGPLLEPTIEAIVITPLSPHTMRLRPIVTDARQKLSIRVSSGRTEIVVTVDGQRGGRLYADEHLVVSRSEKYTRLLVPQDYDFFALLNEKL